MLLHRIARACCRYELSNVVLYYIVNIPGNRGLSIPRLGTVRSRREREERKKKKKKDSRKVKPSIGKEAAMEMAVS